MSSPPVSRRTSNSDPLVSSSDSRVESRDDEQSKVKEKSKSTSPPVMKTHTKKHDQREAYKAIANESSTSKATYAEKNHDIRKNFKTEIDTAQKLNAKKQQWDKFSTKISRDGILEIKDVSIEKIEDITNWLKLSPHSKLTGLKIAESNIDESIVVTLNKFIQTHTTITTLELIGTKMGNVGVKALAAGIPRSKITTLNLSEIEMGPSGRKVLFEAIQNSNITTLNLSHNRLGVNAARELANLIPKSKINALDISDNEIGTEGVKFLAESLKSNMMVAALNLRDNDIDAEGVEALAELMKNNTQITKLILQENNYSKEAKIYEDIINTQCLLNSQSIIKNNIATAMDLLTSHPNPIDGNVTSVRDVNGVIAEKLFALDKADKLNTDEIKKDPNSVFNKYT